MQLKRFSQNFFAPALVVVLAGAAPMLKPGVAHAATPDEMGLALRLQQAEASQTVEGTEDAQSPQVAGLLVTSVTGAAEQAGLQAGDLITSVTTFEELEERTSAAAALVSEGETFEYALTVVRDGQELTLSLTLPGTKPTEAPLEEVPGGGEAGTSQSPGDDGDAGDPQPGDPQQPADPHGADPQPADSQTDTPLIAQGGQVDQDDGALTLVAQGGQDEDDATPTLVAQAATPTVTYRAHVQNIGWQGTVTGGQTAGTTGQSRRVEGLTASVSGVDNLGIEYTTHVQNIGWQGWRSDGAEAGTTGRSLRLEALRMRLTGSAADQYDIWYRVHAQNVGWMGWARNGQASGTAGMSYRLEGVQIQILPKGSAAPSSSGQNEAMPFLGTLTLQAHVQNQGWLSPVHDPNAAGTTGKSQRMEALRVSVDGGATDGSVSGGIAYQAHVQNVGWQGWASDGELAGTTGRSLRVEAVRMHLTGEMASQYDLYYRMHVANIGWLGWAASDASAGTEGMSRAVESVQVRLVPHGQAAPSNSGAALANPFVADHDVSYATLVHGQGWTGESAEGSLSGTTGQSRAIDGMRARVVAPSEGALDGGIQYRTHLANIGWTDYVTGDATTVSSTAGKQAEAIQMRLTGTLANHFDVWYRAYIQNVGWLGWACNGQTAGSTGESLRVEAVEVQVRAKGQGAPGSTANHQYVAPKAWQNPSWMFQVSSNTVRAWWTQGYGKFSYVTPSRISSTASRDEVVNAFISRAWEYIGTPYIWDYACAPGVGVDCAGLVLQCGYAVGMDFGDMNPYNHYYAGGWHEAYANALWNSGRTQNLLLGSRRRGDLISWEGHVAIYLGNDRMIEAYPGVGVQETSIWAHKTPRGAIRLFS